MAPGSESQSRGGMGQTEIGTEVAGLGWGRGLGRAQGTLETAAAEERRESE